MAPLEGTLEPALTDTRELVADRREQYAFHDDIVYLKETRRGLSRATVDEISGFQGRAGVDRCSTRLRAFDHFLKRPMPMWRTASTRSTFDKIVY